MSELSSRRVVIRRSHPFLYRTIMSIAVGCVLLAVNFWNAQPAFNPYSWPKNGIGVIFFVIGASQFVALNVVRDLRIVRVTLWAAFVWNLFWGASNTPQWYDGKASLQLPIYCVIVASAALWCLLEPPINPMTERRK